MTSNRGGRVIMRDQRQGLSASAEPPVESRKEASESTRRVQRVVSAWVREGQNRSAERRVTLNSFFESA